MASALRTTTFWCKVPFYLFGTVQLNTFYHKITLTEHQIIPDIKHSLERIVLLTELFLLFKHMMTTCLSKQQPLPCPQREKKHTHTSNGAHESSFIHKLKPLNDDTKCASKFWRPLVWNVALQQHNKVIRSHWKNAEPEIIFVLLLFMRTLELLYYYSLLKKHKNWFSSVLTNELRPLLR